MIKKVILIISLFSLIIVPVMGIEGYTYHQSIDYSPIIDESSYQQDIVIHRSMGINYEEPNGVLNTWHVYMGDHCKENYGDIRFMNNGKELSYYLWPEFNSSIANFCVKLVNSSINSLDIWYGNSSAESTSNGDGTYVFFDDFIGSSIDTDKWGIPGNNGITLSDSILHVSANPGVIEYANLISKNSFDSNVIITANLQLLSPETPQSYFTSIGFGSNDYLGNGSSMGLIEWTNYESAIYTGLSHNNMWVPPRTASQSLTGGDIITNPSMGFFSQDWVIPDNDYLKARQGSDSWITSTNYKGISNPSSIHILHLRYYHPMDIDYILARKYIPTPPSATFSTGYSIADFTANRTEVIVGGAINFIDLSTESPSSWLWNFGDSSTSTDQNPVHVYSDVGNYTVLLSVSSMGNISTEIKEEYIQVNNISDDLTISDFYAETYSDTVIHLTWEDSTDPSYHHVKLYLDNIWLVDVLSWVEMYDVVNLEPNTTYTFQARAVDYLGNIGSIELNCTDTTFERGMTHEGPKDIVTDRGSSWIRWSWVSIINNLTVNKVVIDGSEVEYKGNEYLISNLNPSEEHIIELFHNTTLLQSSVIKTQPEELSFILILSISGLLLIISIFVVNNYQIILLTTLSTLLSSSLIMSSWETFWIIPLIGTFITIISGTILIITLLDLFN